MATIGLCMIVHNEAPIIERCLYSVLQIIDYACIVDVGSSDDTIEVAARFLKRNGVAHDFRREIWRDSSSSRNEAIEWLRRNNAVDYCLMLDANHVVRYERGFDSRKFKKHLQSDVYDVCLRNGHTENIHPILFQNCLDCHYKGKVCEIMVMPPDATRGDIKGFHLEIMQGSASGADTEKFFRDAKGIEQAMAEETDPLMLSRYRFYLAKSYMDGGDLRRAIKEFSTRVSYGGNNQEIFISLLRIARLMERLDYREERVVHAYLKAWSACPQRAEPLCDLAAYSRRKEQWLWARLFASKGLHIRKPAKGCSIESDVYAYRLLDEYARAAYMCGSFRESLAAWTRLLECTLLPESERSRIVASAQRALMRL